MNRARAARPGRRMLLVGGAGRMGRRLAGFFAARGFRVEIADPAGTPLGYTAATLDDAAGADVVIVAASLPQVGEALDAVLARRPRGLVLDIASIKAPVSAALRRAVEVGIDAASIHPMFGPVRSFRGRDLIVCDAGNPSAARRARRLFDGAGLKIRTMRLDEHDPWAARTMGFSHLVALAVASSLVESGTDVSLVDGAASTSFRRLLGLLPPILDQAPELTFGIQAGNPEARAMAELLEREVGAWRRALFEGGADAFRRKLLATRDALARRPIA